MSDETKDKTHYSLVHKIVEGLNYIPGVILYTTWEAMQVILPARSYHGYAQTKVARRVRARRSKLH